MTSQSPGLAGVMARLEMILERLNALEFQVSGLMQSASVEAEAIVLRDARAQVHARLDLWDHAPCLTFYDRVGEDRLRLGLHRDGTPNVSGFKTH